MITAYHDSGGNTQGISSQQICQKIQISFSCFIKYNVEKHCWGAHVKMITKVHRGVGPNDYSITYMGGGSFGTHQK